ncbi:MAG: PTS sugar transporter subunit IIA [Clostridiales Family XIII bacterium]|nr:PTS sugar transporter subunit IIA [Clostridiales Family XIII bacterium]
MHIEDKLICIGLEAADRTDLLRQMVARLVSGNYVTEDFLRDIEAREVEYPTGLRIENAPYAFAIPHAHSACVLKDGICAATLKTPIEFGRMDEPELTVGASIVFMLAAKDSDLHLELLSDIVKLFSDAGFAQALMDAKNPDAFNRRIRDALR